MNIFEPFDLRNEKENPKSIYENISKGIPFKGTNLWILIFAILIASLGLNINSNAVIIGAMLISPLMGPIMGLGYSLAVNDIDLLKLSFRNYAFAAIVGLISSTFYFLLTPIHEAQSEILARTQPTIYDVLIALCGGFAGVLATMSKQKGNVIPGVAIATALMPPLCTAGYGLANGNAFYLFGAMYLFLINSVFISLATYITSRYLKLPLKTFLNNEQSKKSKRWLSIISIITLIPSIYFAYDIVSQKNYEDNAELFIKEIFEKEGNLIIQKNINAAKKEIDLKILSKPMNDSLMHFYESKMSLYELGETKLSINKGIRDFNKEKEIADTKNFESNKIILEQMQYRLDSIEAQYDLEKNIFKELHSLYPNLAKAFIQKAHAFTDSTENNATYLINLKFSQPLSEKDKEQLQRYLELKLQPYAIELNLS